jgi:hypothetical protein
LVRGMPAVTLARSSKLRSDRGRRLISRHHYCCAGSNAEGALVGKKRRRAARVQEDDILLLAPTPLADQGHQACEPLARIDRIEWESLETAGKPDGFDRSFVRDPVGRSRVSRDDFHRGFVERYIQQIGGFSRQGHDIGAHPRGLGVDVNSNDPRIRHCQSCAGNETRLRAVASGAVHDGSRSEAQVRSLRFDLRNRRGIGDGAQGVRNSVRHEVWPVTLRFEVGYERVNGCIAVPGPRYVMEVCAKQPIEKRVA